jgi:hypothetical protein
MPRIYNSENEALDFCKRHFPKSEDVATKLYADCDYDTEHPPYGTCEYDCEFCGKRLTDDDN